MKIKLGEFPEAPQYNGVCIKAAAVGQKGHVHGERHLEGGQIRKKKEPPEAPPAVGLGGLYSVLDCHLLTV